MNEFTFEKYFVDSGSVGLWVTHPDRSTIECFRFRNLDEMEACALAHRYIPQSVWEELIEMLKLTKSFYKSLHLEDLEWWTRLKWC